MNRRVLLVTPFFAPQSHAAVFRAHRLAKWLARDGWAVHVVTTDRNYHYPDDPALLDDLAGVTVHRARFVEPSLRGVRMLLGGRDRTFAALRTRDDDAAVPPATNGALRGIYRGALDRWVHRPDRFWPWRRPATALARRVVREHGIGVVCTSFPPFTVLAIGRALQQDGCRWVADFRDPGTYAARIASPHGAVYLRQRTAERAALTAADAATAVSSTFANIFADLHGEAGRRPVHFIPTGADDDLLPARRERARPPYVVFSGEFLEEYGDGFAAVWEQVHARMEDRTPRLLVVGRREVNERLLRPQLERRGLGAEFRDHVPQRDLYPLLAGATAGILPAGPHGHWASHFAKLTDFIALGLPVLAMLPDPSEARAALERTGLGVFLDGPAPAAAECAVRFLAAPDAIRSDPAECRRYRASHQAQAFGAVFTGLLAAPARGGDRP